MTDSLSAAVSRCLSHGGPFVWSWVGGQGWGTGAAAEGREWGLFGHYYQTDHCVVMKTDTGSLAVMWERGNEELQRELQLQKVWERYPSDDQSGAGVLLHDLLLPGKK